MFYAIRYVAGTPLADRKHRYTEGRWADHTDAEAARMSTPRPDLLEVVDRGDP